MVEKHKLIGDFELQTFTPEMLQAEWDALPSRFLKLVSGGWTDISIINLIEYIRLSGYAKTLFPGTSSGTLLISKPRAGILNYQQTLSIFFIKETKSYVFEYSDWDKVDSLEKSVEAIKWSADCLAEQLIDKFKAFVIWNNNWFKSK